MTVVQYDPSAPWGSATNNAALATQYAKDVGAGLVAYDPSAPWGTYHNNAIVQFQGFAGSLAKAAGKTLGEVEAQEKANIPPPGTIRGFLDFERAALGAKLGWIVDTIPDPRYKLKQGPVWISNAFGGGYYQNQGPHYELDSTQSLNTAMLGFTGVTLTPNLPARTGFNASGTPVAPTVTRTTAAPWYVKKIVQVGFTDTAHPVRSYTVTLPFKDAKGALARGYVIPPFWDLNEGWQAFGVKDAASLHGIPIGATALGAALILSPNHTNLLTDTIGFLFIYDPSPYIRTGIIGEGYVGGPNVGQENWQAAIRAVGFATVFIGGAALAGADLGAAAAGGAAAGAGDAAGAAAAVSQADLLAIAPGAEAVASGATGGIEALAVGEEVTQAGLMTVASGAEAAAGGATGGIAAEGAVDMSIAPGAYAAAGGATGGIGGGVSQAGLLSGITLPTAGEIGTAGLKAVAGTLIGKAMQALAPKPAPKAKTTAGPTPQPQFVLVGSGGSNPSAPAFSSTTTGQIVIGVVAGVIVIILAKVLLK